MTGPNPKDTMSVLSSCWVLLLSVYVLQIAATSLQKPTFQSVAVLSDATHTYMKVIYSTGSADVYVNCSIKQRGLPRSVSANAVFSNLDQVRRSESSNVECSWTADLSGVNPGLLQVQVEVTLHGSTVSSDWTDVANLSLPTVSTSTNCPVGEFAKISYIKAGEEASCWCQVTSPGYPPGSAQWVTANGTRAGQTQSDGVAILKVDYSMNGSSFYCQPVTVLNSANVQRKKFSPQFAERPGSVIIDLSDANPLCPGQLFLYTITCRVPNSGLNPRLLFTIVLEEEVLVANRTGIYDAQAKEYSLTVKRRPAFGGDLRVYCLVANELFGDLSSELERPYPIPEPPRLDPVLECINCERKPRNGVLYITNGSNVHVTCSVEGGYPRVNSVTIVCGSIYTTHGTTVATLLLDKPDLADKIRCRCDASHVSRCYQNTASLILALAGSNGDTTDPSAPETIIAPTTNGSANPSLTIGLAVGLGCACLILVVALVAVAACKRRRASTVTYNQPDFNFSVPHQYDSFRSADRNPPQLPPSRQTSDSDYHIIPADAVKIQTSLKTLDPGWQGKSTTDALRESEIPEGYMQPV